VVAGPDACPFLKTGSKRGGIFTGRVTRHIRVGYASLSVREVFRPHRPYAGPVKRSRLSRILPLALTAALLLSGTATADQIENSQTLDNGATVRQFIKRAHGRAKYKVNVRGIEVRTICTRFGIERWADDHWTMRGFGRLVTPLNAGRTCDEFRPPSEGASLFTGLILKGYEQVSNERHVRRGLRSGRLRLHGITIFEDGSRVELILRS
jgi:hypothetical protein